MEGLFVDGCANGLGNHFDVPHPESTLSQYLRNRPLAGQLPRQCFSDGHTRFHGCTAYRVSRRAQRGLHLNRQTACDYLDEYTHASEISIQEAQPVAFGAKLAL